MVMTEAQETALRNLCERFNVEFSTDNFHPTFDLPSDWLAGWVGTIYVGVSPDGAVSS